MLLIPIGKTIRIFNISLFQPRTPPKFPLDDLTLMMSTQMHLGDDVEREASTVHSTPTANAPTANESTIAGADAEGNAGSNDGGSVDGAKEAKPRGSSTKYPPPAPLAALFDDVEGWEVTAELQRRDGPPEMPDITMCAMGFEGLRIVGIGQQGTLFVWRLRR